MSMTIRLPGRGRRDFHIGTALPIDHREGARVAGGLFLLLFGGVFAGFPIGFVPLWIRDPASFSGSAVAAGVVLTVFLLVGLGIMAAGVNAWLHRLEIRIDSSGVRGLRRGLRGTRNWHEPLSRYRGVLPEEEYHSGGENRSSYTLYKITLKHAADEDRDVLLYSTRSSQGHRDETEAFARLLARPVLLESGEGEYTERAVTDLDKSVRELAAEGKLAIAAAPSGPPPGDRLRVRPEGNGHVVRMHYRNPSSFITALIFAGVGSGLVYWYFGPGITGGEGSPWVVPVVGGGFAAVGLFGLVFAAIGHSVLHVTPDGVRSTTGLAGRVLHEQRLAASAIEEVSLKARRRGQRKLRMSGDAGRVEFGAGLDREALTYLRDLVIATLARR